MSYPPEMLVASELGKSLLKNCRTGEVKLKLEAEAASMFSRSDLASFRWLLSHSWGWAHLSPGWAPGAGSLLGSLSAVCVGQVPAATSSQTGDLGPHGKERSEVTLRRPGMEKADPLLCIRP